MRQDGNRLSDGSMWSPKFSFFKKGETLFQNPYTNSKMKLEWNFEIVETPLPISYTVCKMKCFEISVSGFGDSFFLRSSMIQSFAEAWERFWMIFMRQVPQDGFPALLSSNGYAAGSTIENAITASREELIDRTILISAWQTQSGWKPFDLKGIRARALSMIIVNGGWELSFFSVSDASQGSILVGLGIHKELGVVFDSSYFSPSKADGVAELKVVRSLLKSVCLQPEISNDPNWKLPEEGGPMDHWIFYRRPENNVAFLFLKQEESSSGTIDLTCPELIQTLTVFNDNGLPAVAVTYHPDWPILCWGKKSISGRNPWPHPMAVYHSTLNTGGTEAAKAATSRAQKGL